MQPHRLPRVPGQAMFGVQFHRFEPLHVFGVEKHVFDNGPSFFTFRRQARQHDLFQNDSVGVGGNGRPVLEEEEEKGRRSGEEEKRGRREEVEDEKLVLHFTERRKKEQEEEEEEEERRGGGTEGRRRWWWRHVCVQKKISDDNKFR